MRKLCQFLGMVNFSHQFLPNCAQIVKPLTDIFTNVKNCDIALAAFHKIKSVLSHAVKLSRIVSGKELCASSVGVGAVLQEKIDDQWKTISFFFRKLSPTEVRYCTSGQELLAAYAAVCNFRYLLEGETFHILTNPYLGVFQSTSDKYAPCETRHLDYLMQFTSDTFCQRNQKHPCRYHVPRH